MSRGQFSHCVVIASLALFLAATLQASTPTLIPLPQQMVFRPGVFTICPSESSYAAPEHPLVKIFTDPVSQPDGQYLAEQFFKSTGWQFVVATTTNGMTVRNG